MTVERELIAPVLKGNNAYRLHNLPARGGGSGEVERARTRSVPLGAFFAILNLVQKRFDFLSR